MRMPWSTRGLSRQKMEIKFREGARERGGKKLLKSHVTFVLIVSDTLKQSTFSQYYGVPKTINNDKKSVE